MTLLSFTMAPMGTFCSVTLTLRNPPVSMVGEIIGDVGLYVAQVVLTNARLGFGRTLPNFYKNQKRQFWARFSTRFRIGGLLFYN